MARPAAAPTGPTGPGGGKFGDILDTPASEVSRPKPAPQGTYRTMVKGLYRIDKSTRKGTEYSEYTHQFLEARDDVDEDALEQWLNGAKLTDKTIRVTMYHTHGSEWRLKKYLTDLGIDEEDSEGNALTLREMMQEVPNRTCLIHIKHTPSEDNETMFANVDRTARDED